MSIYRRDFLKFGFSLPFYPAQKILHVEKFRENFESNMIYRYTVSGIPTPKKIFLAHWNNFLYPGWHVDVPWSQEIRWQFTGYINWFGTWIPPMWEGDMDFYVLENNKAIAFEYAVSKCKKDGIKFSFFEQLYIDPDSVC